jgi:hypothetical protein
LSRRPSKWDLLHADLGGVEVAAQTRLAAVGGAEQHDVEVAALAYLRVGGPETTLAESFSGSVTMTKKGELEKVW